MCDHEWDTILPIREIPSDFDIRKHIASSPFRTVLARQAKIVPTLQDHWEMGFVSFDKDGKTAIVEISGDGSEGPDELTCTDEERERITGLLGSGYLEITNMHFHRYRSLEYHPIWLLPSLNDIDDVPPISDREGYMANYIVIGFAIDKGNEARCLLLHLQKYLSEEMAEAYERDVGEIIHKKTNFTEAQVLELLDSYGIQGEFFSLKRNGKKTEIVFEGSN